MIDRIARFAANAVRMRAVNGARLRHQWRDFVTLRQALGTAPSEFYAYRMWDRDRTPEERVAYLTLADRRKIEGVLNPVPLQKSLLDKLAITTRLRDAGIPVPGLVASYHATTVSKDSPWRSLHGEAGLGALVKEGWPDGLVIKPNDGGAGRDVHVFMSVQDGYFHLVDGRRISPHRLASVLARRRNVLWKIERRVLPHRQLNAVVPDVLATLRVMSFRHRNGTTMIGPSVWKIPQGRSGVDNFARGSLAAPIDPHSGTIGAGRRSSSDTATASHPQTGVRFQGMQIPYWSEVDRLVRDALDVLPGLHGIGWDVGITDAGPVIIEANPWWGADVLQVPHGRGLVQGAFADYLHEFGLGELVQRREATRAGLA
jgi:hypothetical protein